jgi:hypothetical protein
MEKSMSRALIISGLLLAIGMSSAAFIFGLEAKHIGSGRQSITVKGLAEKPIKADYAQWTITAQTQGQTFADALQALRAARPALDDFLHKSGFDKTAITEGTESVAPNMVDEETSSGQMRQVQKGFLAHQDLLITSHDLAKIEATHKAAIQFIADGHPVTDAAPLYLVSNLEDVKMSLIGAATKNARQRAEEFAKNGNVKAGAMHSASQGAFYILPAGAAQESGASDYGGTYDKSTVDKLARVVVTIEYNIDN